MPRGKRNWHLPVGRTRFERAMGQHRVDPATHQAQNAQNRCATHPLPLALLIRSKTEPALLLDQDKPALEGRVKKITNGRSQQHQTENDRDGYPRLDLQELHQQTRGRPGTDGGEVDRAGPGLGELHQLRHGIRSETGIDDQHQRPAHEQRDRSEIGERVVRKAPEEVGVGGVAVEHGEQRGAVGRGLDRRRGAERSPRPRAVFNEELLAERGLDISYETVRRWVLKFGPAIARRLRQRRHRPSDRWHLDEMVVRIAGERMYLWRAVDHEGEGSRHAGPAPTRHAGGAAADAQAAQEARVCPEIAGHRQAALLRRGVPASATHLPA